MVLKLYSVDCFQDWNTWDFETNQNCATARLFDQIACHNDAAFHIIEFQSKVLFTFLYLYHIEIGLN